MAAFKPSPEIGDDESRHACPPFVDCELGQRRVVNQSRRSVKVVAGSRNRWRACTRRSWPATTERPSGDVLIEGASPATPALGAEGFWTSSACDHAPRSSATSARKNEPVGFSDRLARRRSTAITWRSAARSGMTACQLSLGRQARPAPTPEHHQAGNLEKQADRDRYRYRA